MDDLMRTLSPAQQKAVALIKITLDCFNSYDGSGLFTGPGRYEALQGRMEVVAVQARDLIAFWGILIKKMLWPTPPKALDEKILALLQDEQPQAVLREMATMPASIIMIARYLHDQDKAARRAAEKAWQAEAAPAPEAAQ